MLTTNQEMLKLNKLIGQQALEISNLQNIIATSNVMKYLVLNDRIVSSLHNQKSPESFRVKYFEVEQNLNEAVKKLEAYKVDNQNLVVELEEIKNKHEKLSRENLAYKKKILNVEKEKLKLEQKLESIELNQVQQPDLTTQTDDKGLESSDYDSAKLALDPKTTATEPVNFQNEVVILKQHQDMAKLESEIKKFEADVKELNLLSEDREGEEAEMTEFLNDGEEDGNLTEITRTGTLKKRATDLENSKNWTEMTEHEDPEDPKTDIIVKSPINSTLHHNDSSERSSTGTKRLTLVRSKLQDSEKINDDLTLQLKIKKLENEGLNKTISKQQKKIEKLDRKVQKYKRSKRSRSCFSCLGP